MGSLESAIEVVGAIWLCSALLFVVGTVVHAAIWSPRPTDDLPKPLLVLMYITVAPKALLAGTLYVLFVTAPLGVLSLWKKLRYFLWHVK
jgi:hypothetical protein